MSNLTDRLFHHINKATKDPEAEKAEREEQAKIKELIKRYKPIYTGQHERIIIATKDYTIDADELKLLKELNDTRKTLLDNTTGLTEEEFKDKWENLSEKYDVLAKFAFGPRIQFFNMIKIFKQAKHDNPKAKATTLAYFDNIIKEIKKVLDDNKETDSEAIYTAEMQTITKGLEAEKKNVPEINNIINLADAKLRKNNNRLDFQEEGGPPVPDSILAEKEADAESAADAERDDFSIGRFFSKALGYAITIFTIILILFVLGIGASFAVNLNVYKPYPYKILYAIYGSLFSLIVIPYTLLYRWAFLGKRPHYYGFIPIVPRFFVHRPIQFLFGWLTYIPDNTMLELEEWRNPPPTVLEAATASATKVMRG
jgi:hypothetical protein